MSDMDDRYMDGDGVIPNHEGVVISPDQVHAIPAIDPSGKDNIDIMGEKNTKIVVSLDNSVEQVLKWDREGYRLIFAVEKGAFLDLDEVDMRALGKVNRMAYGFSKEMFETAAYEDPMIDLMQDFSIGFNSGTASDRLKIKNKDPNFTYYWPRPEDVGKYQDMGYAVVQGSNEKTMRTRGRGIHYIGKKGEEELILMKTPNKNAEKIKKERGRLNDKRAGKLSEKQKRDMVAMTRSTGGRYFTHDELDDMEKKGDTKFGDAAEE